MTVLLVVSILALILSPLSWLRTSRKQSEQMKLRLEARRMGLAMQLAPKPSMRVLMSGEASAAAMSLCSRSTMGLGVPAGAKMPNQTATS